VARVKVSIPSPLFSYTDRRSEVEASGATLDALLRDLDRQFPGIRFRMVDEQDRLRPHVRIFVNREETRRLGAPLTGSEEIHIFQALSGG
jgi:molybdopterin converting factor small subunit